MNLDKCYTVTTVEFGGFDKDEVRVKFFKKDYEALEGEKLARVMGQVDRIREKFNISDKVKIFSENNFPADAGIASSASAFSALTKAIYEALEEKISEKELTVETRLAGSGSAVRSIPDGFVEWKRGEGEDSDSSYAHSLAQPDYWELCDIVAVVDTSKKLVGSSEGHGKAENEYMDARLQNISERNRIVREAIKEKNIEKLGVVVEKDAISLHTVAMNSEPPIYYLNGRTWDIISELLKWRKDGLLGYFTMDAGPNVHVICEKKDSEILSEKIRKIPGVEFLIVNKAAKGAHVINNHLF
jgi:diphosphomevalonate decarboxylase